MTTIREIMHHWPITLRPGSPLPVAVELLIEHGVSGLPVVSEAGEILGILSEKDLLKVFYERDAATVETVMTRDPIAIDVEAPLVEVFDCLMANDFRRVLVHERGKLVGLVTRADLMPAILAALLDCTDAGEH